MRARLPLLFLAATLCVAARAQTAPTAPASPTALPFLSPAFGDNMVIQRGLNAPVWGWTAPGATVTVQMDGQSATATADTTGRWEARLPKMEAGGPYTLTVSGPEKATLRNVMVGDVWVCSGQSNMEMGIKSVRDAQKEIAEAKYPRIRLYHLQRATSYEPLPTMTGEWEECSPETIVKGGAGFSAAAYFFGRKLYKDLKVPIGLIETNWGGTPAEAWTSAEALAHMPAFAPALDRVVKDGAARAKDPSLPAASPSLSTTLYNGMIAPLIPYGIKGAIWYQGEANAGRAYQYRTLLPTMIDDWRTRWNQGNFPFLIVQLANYTERKTDPGDSDWAELREAQAMTAERLPNTGMAVIIDIGEAQDIHPKNKQDVGKRLALAAEAMAYGMDVPYSGPTLRSTAAEGNAVRLSFDNTYGGLVTQGDKLAGFAVAGADRKFVWADAKIDGDTVVVSSKDVPQPVAVRYAWANNPEAPLYNKAGLPASPFRTDTWPGVTMK